MKAFLEGMGKKSAIVEANFWSHNRTELVFYYQPQLLCSHGP